MKITKQQLKRIIKEELEYILSEGPGDDASKFGWPRRHRERTMSSSDAPTVPHGAEDVRTSDYDPHQTDVKGKYQSLADAASRNLKRNPTPEEHAEAEDALWKLELYAERDPDAQALLDAVLDKGTEWGYQHGARPGASGELYGSATPDAAGSASEAELDLMDIGDPIRESKRVTRKLIEAAVKSEMRIRNIKVTP